MKFAFIENEQISKYPVGIVDLRRKFPGISFPANLSNVNLLNYGAAVVKETTPPFFDPEKSTLQEKEPIFENGEWREQWEVVSFDSELLETIRLSKVRQAKNTRNKLLSESDWTQLPDAPVDKEAWASYRQKLRDITLQEGFPSSIEWPVAPEN